MTAIAKIFDRKWLSLKQKNLMQNFFLDVPFSVSIPDIHFRISIKPKIIGIFQIHDMSKIYCVNYFWYYDIVPMWLVITESTTNLQC